MKVGMEQEDKSIQMGIFMKDNSNNTGIMEKENIFMPMETATKETSKKEFGRAKVPFIIHMVTTMKDSSQKI